VETTKWIPTPRSNEEGYQPLKDATGLFQSVFLFNERGYMRYNYQGVIGEITDLPGCAQVAVFHNVWAPMHLRGQSKGQQAHAARLQEARHLGYKFAICTALTHNHTQNKILVNNGWTALPYFTNPASGSHVVMWWIAL
jgi:hypothetical protein